MKRAAPQITADEPPAGGTPTATTDSLVDAIDAWLPQTQCTRCGYPRCREYAAALSAGETAINRCPPGGERVITALAGLLGEPVEPLDTGLGNHSPALVARIREPACIGCTLCIQVCPTDAIVGAAKRMHTVISNECTGCELCLPACPVDCIELIGAPAHGDADSPWRYYSREQTARYRRRTERRIQRLAVSTRKAPTTPPEPDAIRQEIRAAVARTRSRRHG